MENQRTLENRVNRFLANAPSPKPLYSQQTGNWPVCSLVACNQWEEHDIVRLDKPLAPPEKRAEAHHSPELKRLPSRMSLSP
jgi:hypothetical protein